MATTATTVVKTQITRTAVAPTEPVLLLLTKEMYSNKLIKL
jgi:hypothetical protein